MKWWHSILLFSQKSPQFLHIVKTISSLGKTVIIKKLLVLPSLPFHGRLKRNLSLPACFPATALPAPHPLRCTYNPLGRAAVRIGTPGMDVRIGTTSPESGLLAAEPALEGAVSHCIPPDSCDPGRRLSSPMKGLGHAGWRWLGTRGRKKEKWPFFFSIFFPQHNRLSPPSQPRAPDALSGALRLCIATLPWARTAGIAVLPLH